MASIIADLRYHHFLNDKYIKVVKSSNRGNVITGSCGNSTLADSHDPESFTNNPDANQTGSGYSPCGTKVTHHYPQVHPHGGHMQTKSPVTSGLGGFGLDSAGSGWMGSRPVQCGPTRIGSVGLGRHQDHTTQSSELCRKLAPID